MSQANGLSSRLLVVAVALLLALSGCVDLKALKNSIESRDSTESKQELSYATIANGLKEALRVGAERATQAASRTDGYLANAQIRIPIPKELGEMTKALRRLGLGEQVNELEVALNRAAEKAATEAKPVFVNAITRMTLDDAIGIYKGGDTAATGYFKSRTSSSLQRLFSPIVREKLQQVGLSRVYGKLAERYNSLPFVTKPAVNLDQYVTEQALNGLFHLLAEEERQIRSAPVARTTDLLKKVFGR